MYVTQVLRDLTRRVDPPSVPYGGLLTTHGHRDTWQDWLANARQSETAEVIFARHPRAARLQNGFAVGAYLTNNPDVADCVDDPVEAVFHYLEFGLPEGRQGCADTWDAGFVARVMGHSLHEKMTAPEAARELLQRGVPVAEVMLCERDLWLSLGLHGPALTNIFHHELYFAALDAADLPLPAPDRLSCIRHFAETGLDAGIPADPDHHLNPAFYRATLAEQALIAPKDDGALPRHWARIGLRAGVHANAAAWALASYGLRLPAAVTATSGGHLGDMIRLPGREIYALDAHNPAIRSFLIDLARHKRRTGADGAGGSAETLLTQVLNAAPDDPCAAVDLADLIHGQGQLPREIALRRIPPADFDSGANRVTLAELSLADGNLDEALHLAASLPTAAAGDVALRCRAATVGRMVFDRIWSDLQSQTASKGVAEVQNLLTRAITLYAPPPDPLPRAGVIRRVAILANDDLYQCKLYRADQKADQLRAHGISTQIYLQSRDVAALHSDLAQYDAVIFQRNPAFPHIAELMIDAARQGIATFYDIDDLIFDTAHFPPPLATYAGQINATQHASIACGVPLFAAAARLCDVGIASTEPIRQALAPLTRSGTAFTHRNALGLAHMAAMRAARATPSGKVVLFYGSGTKAHKADFRDILEPALARVLQDRPGQVEIRLMGDFPDLTHLNRSHPDVTVIPPIRDFECYAAELAQADVALSVLTRSAITDAKSELKWSEPAMFAIPSVVSPTPVMDAAIEHGETGFLAGDTESFTQTLLRLVDDPALRTRIGKTAQKRVLHNCAIDKMGAALARNMAATRAAPKPKLLVVNVFYPPQDIGGATRVVADNVTHLLTRYGDEFEIDILTTLEGGKTPHHVQAVSHSGARIWAVTAADGVNERAISDPVMDTRVEALLDHITPDIVHFHCIQRLGAGIIDLCRKRGIPYVLTLHDGWWCSPHQFILGPDGTPAMYDFHADTPTRPERVQITRRCLTDAAALLAVSEPFAKLHRDIGLPNVQALPNGVSNLPKRIRKDGPKGRVRLGLIGGATRHKGYDLLRAALTARAYDNLDLLIVDHALAPGAEVEEVWNTTPVRRIPRQPQAEVGALYGAFDVLMAPSTWPESYGLVAREALALGLWVVASDRGAIGADIAEGVTGHVVPVDDHRALGDVLARIDANPTRYSQAPLGKPNLRTAAQQADELATLYKTILEQDGQALKTESPAHVDHPAAHPQAEWNCHRRC